MSAKPDLLAGPDPLVAALALLSRHFERPFAPEQIVRGLPLANGRLDPAYLAEAATNAGLLTRPGELTPASLTPLALPAIAFGREGEVLVLLERKGRELRIARPLEGDAASWVNLRDLVSKIQPQGHFVRGRLYFDARSQLYDPAPARDWFWGPLRHNAWIYGVAAVASLVINLAATLTALYVMAVYDRVIPNRALDTLWVLTSGVAALYVLDAVLKSLRGYMLDVASRRFDVLVGSRVFAKVLALTPAGRSRPAPWRTPCASSTACVISSRPRPWRCWATCPFWSPSWRSSPGSPAPSPGCRWARFRWCWRSPPCSSGRWPA